MYEAADRPLSADGREIACDQAWIRFVEAPAGSREVLATLVLDVADPQAMLARARARGLPTSERAFELYGVSCRVC